MNRLVKMLADDDKYFHIFLGVLCVYAFIGVVICKLISIYSPIWMAVMIIVFLTGAIGVGFVARIAHNMARLKLRLEAEDDNSNPV